jgi:hypothetical protein
LEASLIKSPHRTSMHTWLGGRASHESYASQFDTPIDRAHRGKARIKARLIGMHDPDEWDLPPKPKWMRWRTYDSLERKFDEYENFFHQSARPALERFLRRIGMG